MTRWLALWLGLVMWTACGDNQVAPGDAVPDMGLGTQCSDGIDNDGDNLVDYPADPGCILPQADDETDDCPDGPSCAQCGNQIDDDANGSTDYPNDPGCDSAGDTTEVINDPVACGPTLMIKNLTATGTDSGTLDTSSTSQITTPCGGGSGSPAIAYRLNIQMPTVIVASTSGSLVDTVLDLRASDCDAPASEIACHNDVSTQNKTSFLSRSLGVGNYFLIVSGATMAAAGPYTLSVERFAGEGAPCTASTMCGPGLVCRVPGGATAMVCTVPQCTDQLDDDGDGLPGYPTDPGCATATDNDETDDCPGGTSCPLCSNDLDDDNDGNTDYPTDLSCVSAGGMSEACNGEVDPIVAIGAALTIGTLIGAADNHDPTCGGEGGGDVLFTLTVPTMRTIQIDTQMSATQDTILSLMSSACTEPSIECDDDDGNIPTFTSLITRTNLPAGSYIVAVDNYSDSPTKVPLGINVNVSGVIAPGGSCEPASTLGGALVCPSTNPCMNVGGTLRCLPSACNDGMDNDSDGATDFPDDPGCTLGEDTSEADTCASGPGPGCPECADGFDNDGDGQTDLADSACSIPSQPSESCASTDGITTIITAVTTGTTVGMTNDMPATCGATPTTQAAPDAMFSLDLPRMRTLTIANSNFFDAIVSLFDSTCGGTPIACLDEPENLSIDNLAAGLYFYSVDGDGGPTVNGPFTLTVSGTIESGGSCEGALAQAGAITCAANFSCKGTAGARTCQRARCSDGLDNDSDGIGDYPTDPGCVSPGDDTEDDTCPGAGCPACGDTVDNDLDGQTDFPDDGTCVAASSTSETCRSSEPVTALVLPLTADTTTGATDDQHPSCGSSTNSAPDKLYSLTVPNLATLSIVNTNFFDAVVALYNSSCGPSTIACADQPEDLTFTNLAAGTYFYVVDGFSTAFGPHQILISGTIEPGESCESILALSGALTCTSGFTCGGTLGARTCIPALCADGINNDTDAFTDYPTDPGCTSASDNDETDACPGAGCPMCADGLDNDTDALADFPLDPQCTSASSTSETCKSTEGIPELVLPITAGTTFGQVHDTIPACASSANTAGDRMYSLQLPSVATLSIVNTNEFDAVVALYNGSCATAAVQCRDTPEDIFVTNQPAGTYFYTVDGFSTGTGAYTLTISGTMNAGANCESPLVESGAIRCPAGYACAGSVGSRTCLVAACADGIDNDTDGAIDYPDEPGCTSREDNDETNPVTAAACSNTSDDDSDLLTDYPADWGCGGAGSTSEAFCSPETSSTRLITANPTTGTTTGSADNFSASTCQVNTAGEEIALGLQLPVPVATLVLDLSNSGFDTVLSLRDTTCGQSIGCDDDSGDPGSQSKLTLTNVAAGGYAVIVDGFGGGNGTYTLAVTGTVAVGTSCASPMFAAGLLACPTGSTCTGTTPTCQ